MQAHKVGDVDDIAQIIAKLRQGARGAVPMDVNKAMPGSRATALASQPPTMGRQEGTQGGATGNKGKRTLK